MVGVVFHLLAMGAPRQSGRRLTMAILRLLPPNRGMPTRGALMFHPLLPLSRTHPSPPQMLLRVGFLMAPTRLTTGLALPTLTGRLNTILMVTTGEPPHLPELRCMTTPPLTCRQQCPLVSQRMMPERRASRP